MEDKIYFETKPKKIEILRAIPNDAQGIQLLVTESSKGMYKLCGWSAEEIADHFNPNKIEEGATKLKKSITAFTEADILLIARDEDRRIVGCCFAEKNKDNNRIEAVYVLSEFQGTGLSDRLFYEVYKLLNPDVITILDVFSLNSKAINFYNRLGFSETGKKTFDERYSNSTGKMLEITEMILPLQKKHNNTK
jgi:ribosomal protein S18 acetylase RimI-like enzyme